MQRLRLTAWACGTGSVSKRVRGFLRAEGGLVTLEWVAIAALLAIGAIVVTGTVMVGLAPPAKNICGQLTGDPKQCP